VLQHQKEALEQQLQVLAQEHGLALARVREEREAWAERARELARRLQQLQAAHRMELEQVRSLSHQSVF
jgi:ribosomal protein L19E